MGTTNLDVLDITSVQVAGVTVLAGQQAAQANTAAATATAFPAGGTGAAAGAWDTAANRDLAIARFAAALADIDALRTTVNALLAKLRTHGIIAT